MRLLRWSALGALASALLAISAPTGELSLRLALLTVLLLVVSRAELHALLDGAVASACLVSAGFAVLDGYRRVWWLDDVTHVGVTGVLAAGAVWALRGRISRLTGSNERSAGRGVWAVTTSVCGLALALGWEMYEWTVVGAFGVDTVSVSYADTMTDLIQGWGGALLSGCVMGAVARNWHATPPLASNPATMVEVELE